MRDTKRYIPKRTIDDLSPILSKHTEEQKRAYHLRTVGTYILDSEKHIGNFHEYHNNDPFEIPVENIACICPKVIKLSDYEHAKVIYKYIFRVDYKHLVFSDMTLNHYLYRIILSKIDCFHYYEQLDCADEIDTKFVLDRIVTGTLLFSSLIKSLVENPDLEEKLRRIEGKQCGSAYYLLYHAATFILEKMLSSFFEQKIAIEKEKHFKELRDCINSLIKTYNCGRHLYPKNFNRAFSDSLMQLDKIAERTPRMNLHKETKLDHLLLKPYVKGALQDNVIDLNDAAIAMSKYLSAVCKIQDLQCNAAIAEIVNSFFHTSYISKDVNGHFNYALKTTTEENP